jgi:hypothetical protein
MQGHTFSTYIIESAFCGAKSNNSNNQAFYSQASWGRLEMKPHERKRRKQRAIKKTKSKKEKKTKDDKKNQIKKRGKDNKTVSGEGLPRNWMILLGHRRLQYIGEKSLGVAGG